MDMGIIEFLLARLDDDEVWAQARSQTEPWRTMPDTAVAARLRQEIAAKRKIVNAAAVWMDGDADSTYSAVMARTVYADTLRALASVYRNHEDYQTHWGVS